MKTLIQNRINSIRNFLSDTNFDTLMVLTEENRRYLSGFTGSDAQFDEIAGTLFITESKLILATDSRYDLQAKMEAPLYEIVCYKDGLDKELKNILPALGTKTIGFESERISFSLYNKLLEQIDSLNSGIRFLPTTNIIEKFRMVKEPFEIEAIRRALFIAETVFDDLTKLAAPGMSEKEAAWNIEKHLREKGADDLSFPVIIASGPNSALPHAVPGHRKIGTDEPVLLDWGVRLNGYCSDISRTVVFGNPDEKFHKIYKIVKDAQDMAIKSILPKMTGRTIDKVARDHIADMGYKDNFGHGLGHGTGLAIHELPRFSPLFNKKIPVAAVCTVEPGIYIPEWGGIRLENMIAVREDGAEVLNQLNLDKYSI